MDLVGKSLRACLLTAAGGLNINSINDDYYQVLGENIPFRELGYNSIEALISNVPGIKLTKRPNGDCYAEAIPSEKSIHVSNMVDQQKKKLRRRSSQTKTSTRRSGSSRPVLKSASSVSSKEAKKITASSSSPEKVISLPTQPQKSVKPLVSPPSQEKTKPSKKKLQQQKAGSVRVAIPTMMPNTNVPSCGRGSGMLGWAGLQQKAPGFQPLQVTVGDIGSTIVSPQLPLKQACSGSQKNDWGVKANHLPPSPLLSPELPPTPVSPLSPMSPLPAMVPNNFFCRNPAQQRLLQVTASVRENRNAEGKHRMSDHKPPSPPPFPTPKGPVGKLSSIQQGPEPYAPGSSIDLLVTLLQSKCWPIPNFVLLPRKPKGSPMQYSCRIIISKPEPNYPGQTKDYDFSSFPHEYTDPNQAKEKAAELAYLELCQKAICNGKEVTSDQDVIVARIIKLVNGQTNGVWTFRIEDDYETQYNEKLPNNWMSLLKSCKQLKTEKLTECSVIVCAVPDSNIFSRVMEYSTPLCLVDPPRLDTWDVYITRVVSSVKVWLRFIGETYSDEFESLLDEMEKFYGQNRKHCRVKMVELEHYYAYISNEGCSRVKVVGDITATTAQVMFIDHGDIDFVPVESLCLLDVQFSRLPAQVIACCLSGLEEYQDNAVLDRMLADVLEGKSLVAERATTKHTSLSSLPNGSGSNHCLVLHDTSGDTQININKYVAQIMELVVYKPLPMSEKVVFEAHLTHMCKDGDVYLQVISSKAWEYVKECLAEVKDELLEERCIKILADVKLHRLYLLRLSPSGTSYRVRVIGPVSSELGEVDIEMVDYGRTLTVPYADLYDLEEPALALHYIPPQAVKVQLKDIPISALVYPEVYKALQALVPANKRVLVKVDSFIGGENGIPVIELFKRIQPDNLIISINHTLRMNNSRFFTEMTKSDSQQNFDFSEIKTSLELAKITLLNKKFFDVYVVSAANPSNFIIQPKSYQDEFKSLLVELDNFYSKEQLGRPLTAVKPGLYCTAYIKKQGRWLRGCIERLVSVREVCFYACDTGEMHVLQTQDLYVLEQSFMKLPALAFNAQLAGIVPLHGDWLVEDTRRFQEVTEGKTLASVILSSSEGVGGGSTHAPRATISLRLVDTSSTSDIDIAHLFVTERRAKYV